MVFGGFWEGFGRIWGRFWERFWGGCSVALPCPAVLHCAPVSLPPSTLYGFGFPYFSRFSLVSLASLLWVFSGTMLCLVVVRYASLCCAVRPRGRAKRAIVSVPSLTFCGFPLFSLGFPGFSWVFVLSLPGCCCTPLRVLWHFVLCGSCMLCCALLCLCRAAARASEASHRKCAVFYILCLDLGFSCFSLVAPLSLAASCFAPRGNLWHFVFCSSLLDPASSSLSLAFLARIFLMKAVDHVFSVSDYVALPVHLLRQVHVECFFCVFFGVCFGRRFWRVRSGLGSLWGVPKRSPNRFVLVQGLLFLHAFFEHAFALIFQ